MPALIDNYTTAEQSEPYITYAIYTIDFDTSTNSVITGSPKREGINYRIHKLLKDFETLEDNWDECDALAPNKPALQWARHLSCLLERHGQPVYHAAPGPNGEIMLDIRNDQKNRTLEIIFYPDRSVIVFFPNSGQPSQEQMDFGHLSRYLEWLND